MKKPFINRRSFLQRSFALSAVAAGGVPSLVAAEEPKRQKAVTAGKGPKTELFLDDEILDMTASVTRKIHQPTKHPLNSIIEPTSYIQYVLGR